MKGGDGSPGRGEGAGEMGIAQESESAAAVLVKVLRVRACLRVCFRAGDKAENRGVFVLPFLHHTDCSSICSVGMGGREWSRSGPLLEATGRVVRAREGERGSIESGGRGYSLSEGPAAAVRGVVEPQS